MNLLTRNSKIKKNPSYTVNFGISAKKSCPMADICKDFCYATKGAYAWGNVKQAFDARFELTKTNEFCNEMIDQLSRKKKVKLVRIHDSGDFYSDEYLKKWYKIIRQFPNIHFYAYTKSVSRLKSHLSTKPNNFTIIYSIGGKEDHLINKNTDRHSVIFESKEALNAAGYTDTSEIDENAIGDNNKVGLVIH